MNKIVENKRLFFVAIVSFIIGTITSQCLAIDPYSPLATGLKMIHLEVRVNKDGVTEVDGYLRGPTASEIKSVAKRDNLQY